MAHSSAALCSGIRLKIENRLSWNSPEPPCSEHGGSDATECRRSKERAQGDQQAKLQVEQEDGRAVELTEALRRSEAAERALREEREVGERAAAELARTELACVELEEEAACQERLA